MLTCMNDMLTNYKWEHLFWTDSIYLPSLYRPCCCVLLRSLYNKGYKLSSIEKFRKVLKFFFKVVYDQNKYYPEQLQWIYTKVSKERDRKKSMDMDEYFEEEEIQKLMILYNQ